jgi:hypothetical protein
MITPNSIKALADLPVGELEKRMNLELEGRGTLLNGIDKSNLNSPIEDGFAKKPKNTNKTKTSLLKIVATILTITGLVVFSKQLPGIDKVKNLINPGADNILNYAKNAKNAVIPKITTAYNSISSFIEPKITEAWNWIKPFIKN